MIIIGELINASRKAIKAAIEAQDAAAIQQVASDQAEAGADYIDVNAGIFVGKEPEYLRWLVETVQQATDKPCAIDSPDPSAIEAALSAHQGTPMINSISLEKDRYDKLMPIIAGTDMKVIALCMSDAGMPQTVDDRMRIADELVGGLLKEQRQGGEHLCGPAGAAAVCGRHLRGGVHQHHREDRGGLSRHPHGLRAFQHQLRAAGQKVHEPDVHDHGDCQGAGRGDHQPAGQEDDGQYHRCRSPGRPGQLLHELPQGVSGGDV
jgi:hypothetical protein